MVAVHPPGESQGRRMTGSLFLHLIVTPKAAIGFGWLLSKLPE